ncbi:IucA/IucC family protein [Kitasatospora sp. NPDC056731]|uniref:IucA/IucC family protein n=1 Tax=Kitasatospora sp. NPDC056731 TaxID=3155422 RepID=UPI003436EFAF
MEYRAELLATLPELVTRYDAVRPAAQAAVLGRLWGALVREPLPGLLWRKGDDSSLTVAFDNGYRVTGPAAAAGIISPALPGLTVGRRTVTDPAALVRALWHGPAGDRLASEVSGSVDGLALARAHRPAEDSGTRDSSWYEQSVVDGHPLHPCCRNRPGMSIAELIRYAPEYRPVIDLPLVAVPRERLRATSDWPLVDGEAFLLPVHPWQRDHVLPRYGLTPATSWPARPLMSLRSLATARWQVKTSIDVQLTAAVRGLSQAAVDNGPALSRVLPDLPGLTFLREVHSARIDSHLSAVLREPPERHLRPGEVAVPFSALATAGPDIAAVVAVAVPPLLRMLDRGIALEAHGQNTLLVLDRDARPVRLLYRDLGGVRISPRRFANCPALLGGLTTDDPVALHTKLAGALVMLLAELIHRTGDETLWHHVARTIDATYAELPADSWNRQHRALFFAPALPVKAYTTMRLADDARTDVWGWTPNPLVGHR